MNVRDASPIHVEQTHFAVQHPLSSAVQINKRSLQEEKKTLQLANDTIR